MDYGQRDTIFVPFFGVATATITGVSRLARLAGARVLPCVTRMLPGGEGYVGALSPGLGKLSAARASRPIRGA